MFSKVLPKTDSVIYNVAPNLWSVYTPHQSKAYTEDYQLASLWHSVFANVDSWFVIYFIDGYIFKLVLRVLKVLFKS